MRLRELNLLEDIEPDEDEINSICMDKQMKNRRTVQDMTSVSMPGVPENPALGSAP
jgi:hypothetical protein